MAARHPVRLPADDSRAPALWLKVWSLGFRELPGHCRREQGTPSEDTMRLLVVVALGLLLLASPVWLQSAEPPAAPKGMLTPPPGTWVQQPNTRVLDALERSLYSQLTPGGPFNAHSFYA